MSITYHKMFNCLVDIGVFALHSIRFCCCCCWCCSREFLIKCSIIKSFQVQGFGQLFQFGSVQLVVQMTQWIYYISKSYRKKKELMRMNKPKIYSSITFFTFPASFYTKTNDDSSYQPISLTVGAVVFKDFIL